MTRNIETTYSFPCLLRGLLAMAAVHLVIITVRERDEQVPSSETGLPKIQYHP